MVLVSSVPFDLKSNTTIAAAAHLGSRAYERLPRPRDLRTPPLLFVAR